MNRSITRLLQDNNELIEVVGDVIWYLRIENYDKGLRGFQKILSYLEKLLDCQFERIEQLNCYEKEIHQDNMTDIIKILLDSVEKSDYILVADILELQLLPLVYRIQDYYMKELNYEVEPFMAEYNEACLQEYNTKLYNLVIATIKKPIDQIDICCEVTQSGYYTGLCKVNNREFYLHSNNNPMSEATLLSQSWFNFEKDHYIVYGLGFAYHICKLLDLDENITIEVYESNLGLIQESVLYGLVGRCVKSGRVEVFYDPNCEMLCKRLENYDDDTEFVIHEPSIKLIPNTRLKESLRQFYIRQKSIKNQHRILIANFKNNIKRYDAVVDELLGEWQGKDIYLVAAGPSLDKNVLELKRVRNNGVIIAAGTVYKKLIRLGIKPDYVVISDGNARVLRQIEGLENETVPLILLATAYKEFFNRYRGKKYLICQSDFSLSEQFAAENNYRLYQTGGSVMTVAVDIAIAAKPKRIIFVGLDLAYTDNYVHALDTSRRNLPENENFETTLDINHKRINTNFHLNMYRKWIENRLKGEQAISFIDATEGGALIKGTKILKLKNIVDEYQ